MRRFLHAEPDTSRDYRYDALGRLGGYDDYQELATSCTMDPNYGEQCTVTGRTNVGTVNYAYDLVGNRTGSGTAYTAGSNRLTSADGYTLGYDLDGNLTSKSKTGYTRPWRGTRWGSSAA